MNFLRLLPLCAIPLATHLVASGATPLGPVPAPAVARAATVEVRIAPDHADWTYEIGQPVNFTIKITADQVPIDGISVTYAVGPEFMPAKAQAAPVPPSGLVVAGGTMKVPGFIRCIATTEINGREYRGLATAGFAPGEIQPTQVEPDDFDAFWMAGKAELAGIPVEPRITLLPDACTDKVNVYHVGLRTIGEAWTAPARVYGILCEPTAPGRYPAILRVPGAGVRPYYGDKDVAARGAITFEIGIHGIPVNQPQEVYDQLLAGALNGYWFFNLDNKDNYYFRRVYLSCLRANDFLTSRPNWDGRNLLVTGASQGGQLSIVTSALDDRVTGLAAIHPGFCDVSGELAGRAGGWPHPFQPDATTGMALHATPEKIATATYYDTVNFARRLRVPGFYTWGYNDEVCSPTSMFAAFNVISAPKELTLQLEVGHAYPAEQYLAVTAWISQFLGLR